MFRSLFGTPKSATPEVTVADVVRMRQESPVQIVDVREPNEWAGGHIPDAIHIPLGQIALRQNELKRDVPIVTVCRSGHRSLNAAELLLNAGFTNVSSMAGGMIAWSKAGQPIK
jgi:rhodanese-related sulfurtransferase